MSIVAWDLNDLKTRTFNSTEKIIFSRGSLRFDDPRPKALIRLGVCVFAVAINRPSHNFFVPVASPSGAALTKKTQHNTHRPVYEGKRSGAR